MNNDLQEILLTQQQIKQKVAELAAQIQKDYLGKEIVLVSVLKGSFVFTADLVRQLDLPVNIQFIVASSYGSQTTSCGKLKILYDLQTDLTDKTVLILEDIIDSGVTLSNLKRLFLSRGAHEVKICALLNKPSRRKADIEIDYYGFEIPDVFIVGYGLDYAEKYRSLPYIGILKPEIYAF